MNIQEILTDVLEIIAKNQPRDGDLTSSDSFGDYVLKIIDKISNRNPIIKFFFSKDSDATQMEEVFELEILICYFGCLLKWLDMIPYWNVAEDFCKTFYA